jgi:hypothetical protein
MINYEVLYNWLEYHRINGGRLCKIPNIREYVHHDPTATKKLYNDFKQNISLEQAEQFIVTNTFDNSMSDRTLLEDACKIFYLERQTIKFLPQVLHEPWDNRWRAHPGSGRYDVLCRRNNDPIPGIYIYFNAPDYGLPRHINLTNLDLEDIVAELCFGEIPTIDFMTYPAFSSHAKERDAEWNPVISPEYIVNDWEFLRYSEGMPFSTYKSEWRDCAVDLWEYLH